MNTGRNLVLPVASKDVDKTQVTNTNSNFLHKCYCSGIADNSAATLSNPTRLTFPNRMKSHRIFPCVTSIHAVVWFQHFGSTCNFFTRNIYMG